MHQKDLILKNVYPIGHLPKLANVSKLFTKLSKAADPSLAMLSSPERLCVCEAAHNYSIKNTQIVVKSYA